MLNYKDFTKRTSVTKSFQQELKPLPATKEYLDSVDFLEKDKEIDKLRETISDVINHFALSFINSSLSDFHFDFSVFDEYKDFTSVKKDALEKFYDTVRKHYTETIKKLGYNKVVPGFTISQQFMQNKEFFLTFLPYWIDLTDDMSFNHNEAKIACESLQGCLGTMTRIISNKITIFNTSVPKRIVENYFIYKENTKALSDIVNDNILPDNLAINAARMSELDGYNAYLSQTEIDEYNRSVSGVSNEKELVEKGINNIVNELNQKNKVDKSRSSKAYHKLRPLYKQFFTDSESAYHIIRIENDKEVKEYVKKTIEKVEKTAGSIIGLFSDADKSGLSVSGKALHTLSNIVYGDHETIPEKMQKMEQEKLSKALQGLKTKKEKEKVERKIENISAVVRDKYYSVPEVESVMDGDDVFKKATAEIIRTATAVKASVHAMESSGMYEKEVRIKNDRERKEMIIRSFETVTALRTLLYVFRVPEENKTDAAFYNDFDDLYDELQTEADSKRPLSGYFTRKPGEEADRVQTCFNDVLNFKTQIWNGTEKFSRGRMTIMRDNGKFIYLIPEKSTKPFDVKEGFGENRTDIFFEKKGVDPMKAIPRVVFSVNYDGDTIKHRFESDPDLREYTITQKVKNPITVTRHIYNIYKNCLHTVDSVKKGIVTEEERAGYSREIIHLYMEFMKNYTEYSLFDLSHLKPEEEYNNTSELFEDVSRYVFCPGFYKADKKQLTDMINEHKLLAFEITSMQLRTGNLKGNSYAAILTKLMSDENTVSRELMLGSNPLIFYRKAILPKTVTHKKGSIIVNKRYKDGSPIPGNLYEAVYRVLNDFPTDMAREAMIALAQEGDHQIIYKKCAYDISKNRRFMEDKFILQANYKKNAKAGKSLSLMNREISDLVKEGCNTLSVIRGTQTLIYYRVCDKDGNELESGNLNVINGIDHWKKLALLGESRKDAQRSWDEAETIKEYRDAYLSEAISKLVRIAVKYNAVILVEKIDETRKNKWSALDNTVFKKFETMLVARCADLFFNDIPDGQPGSQTNPYHLADTKNNSQYQNGIIYFVSTPYLSIIDPETGFAPVFKLSDVNTPKLKQQFLGRFKEIKVSDGKICYSFDYNRFNTIVNTEKTEWTLTGSGHMTTYDRIHRCYNHYKDMVNDYLMPAFSKNNINADENLAKLAADGSLDENTVSLLYNVFRTIAFGTRKCILLDNTDAYISPVSNKAMKPEFVSAYNLERKWKFAQSYDGKNDEFITSFINSLVSEKAA